LSGEVGDAVRNLWEGNRAPDGDRSVARRELTGSATSIIALFGASPPASRAASQCRNRSRRTARPTECWLKRSPAI
jgi:hypothetical protein